MAGAECDECDDEVPRPPPPPPVYDGMRIGYEMEVGRLRERGELGRVEPPNEARADESASPSPKPSLNGALESARCLSATARDSEKDEGIETEAATASECPIEPGRECRAERTVTDDE